jgi:hypothetical protein
MPLDFFSKENMVIIGRRVKGGIVWHMISHTRKNCAREEQQQQQQQWKRLTPKYDI